MLLVGLDDTDSVEGGCTTSLAEPVVALFPELRLLGAPRLVRLNPNVPWKTRGNGAIALRFEGDLDLDEALDRAWGLVERHAQRHERTSPGVVVSPAPPDPALYDAAVSRIVAREEAYAALQRAGAWWRGDRGVIGAAAALAWNPFRQREDQDVSQHVETAAIAWPAERSTWERIAYRHAGRIGTPREVDDAWVREVEWGFPSIFDSYDLVHEEVVCVPSSPCPVLWGLRGEDPAALEKASLILGPERPARETLFLTNQGTDDHLRRKSAAQAREYDSVLLRGRVTGAPFERNGSVFLDVRDGTGSLRAAAYPPTRGFRNVARALDAGDEVVVCGGLHAGPDGALTLGLEKLEVVATAPRRAGNPLCGSCGRTMKSAGHDAGYRCRECGTHADAARTADSILHPGWYEVPSCARRHLAMPLRRASAGASARAGSIDADAIGGGAR